MPLSSQVSRNLRNFQKLAFESKNIFKTESTQESNDILWKYKETDFSLNSFSSKLFAKQINIAQETTKG